MRYRVERERTDHGYGYGWCILDEHGEVINSYSSWVAAFASAFMLATMWSIT